MENETQKKKVNVKLLVTIIGSILIVIGLLLVLIPSFITPNYRLYKGGVDVTNLYLSNNIVDSCYLVDENFVIGDKSDLGENEFINVNTEEIINDNNIDVSSSTKVMMKLNFTIDLEDYDPVSYTVTQNDLKVEVINDSNETFYSYNVNSIYETSLRTDEIIIDLNNIEDYQVIYSGKITIMRNDDNNETKDLTLNFNTNYFFLEFYKE